MDKWRNNMWKQMPTDRRQEIVFAIDEIIENNMVEFPCGTIGAKFSTVMQEAIDAGYREVLFRKVIQMMIEEQMIFCGHILIHRFSDVQKLWPEYSMGF